MSQDHLEPVLESRLRRALVDAAGPHDADRGPGVSPAGVPGASRAALLARARHRRARRLQSTGGLALVLLVGVLAATSLTHLGGPGGARGVRSAASGPTATGAQAHAAAGSAAAGHCVEVHLAGRPELCAGDLSSLPYATFGPATGTAAAPSASPAAGARAAPSNASAPGARSGTTQQTPANGFPAVPQVTLGVGQTFTVALPTLKGASWHLLVEPPLAGQAVVLRIIRPPTGSPVTATLQAVAPGRATLLARAFPPAPAGTTGSSSPAGSGAAPLKTWTLVVVAQGR